MIIRCGTGVDSLIFRLRNTLVDYLGFSQSDVELLYYDHEDQDGKGRGQQAPTASKFKEKFEELISSAASGHVRFVYVDAPAYVENGENNGWLLSQSDGGSTSEAVKEDWITSTIRGVRYSVVVQ